MCSPLESTYFLFALSTPLYSPLLRTYVSKHQSNLIEINYKHSHCFHDTMLLTAGTTLIHSPRILKDYLK